MTCCGPTEVPGLGDAVAHEWAELGYGLFLTTERAGLGDDLLWPAEGGAGS